MTSKKALSGLFLVILVGVGVLLWKGGYIGRWIRGYKKLPELKITKGAIKERKELYRDFIPHNYGIDENNNGKIDTEEIRYRLMLPPNWSVENNTGGPNLSTGSVIFRFYGDNGIWGAVIKVDISNLSNKSSEIFMQYYTNKEMNIASFLESVSQDEYKMEIHKRQTTKSKFLDGRVFPHYEVYATEEFPRGKYVSIAIYDSEFDYAYDELGFVIKTYIPPEHFNHHTRTVAFLIGSQFIHYTH